MFFSGSDISSEITVSVLFFLAEASPLISEKILMDIGDCKLSSKQIWWSMQTEAEGEL